MIKNILLVVLCSTSVMATTRYVNLNNSNPVAPYTSWETAATNIQPAVDVAVHGDTVRVADGTYYPESEIVVPMAITLISENGLNSTIIDGSGAHRCFSLGSSACTLSGLTITNGYRADFDNTSGFGGGGIYCDNTTPVVASCVIAGNTSRYIGYHSQYNAYGGGMYQGTANNCIFKNNSVLWGVIPKGGGMAYGIANNCLFIDNIADNNSLYNGGSGGGMYGGIANNCIFIGNKIPDAYAPGAGFTGEAANNCIAWGNIGDSELKSSNIRHCCSPDLTHGVDGNITNAPRFFKPSQGDFRLWTLSPCINAGSNIYVSTSVDLTGNPRISGDSVDMGVYEYQDADNDRILDAWEEVHFGSMTNCAPDDDPDVDRYSNFDEFLTRVYNPDDWNFMNPNVWGYYLEANFVNEVDFSWRMVNGTNYQVQCCSDLTSNLWDNVGSVIIGNETTDAHFNESFDTDQKFYRVIIVP